MKKSLVALAALAATSAFAQFSIDGNMDVGYASIKYDGTSVSGIINNGANTSQINFRGAQDLGGGMKASFRVETDWNTVSNNGNTGTKNADGTVAAGSSFGNGEIRTGIAGGFGAIDAGAVNNAQLTAYLTGQPFGTAIGSGFRGIYSTDAANAMAASPVRFDNSVRYTTPSINGFSATFLTVTKNSKAATNNFSTTFGNYDYRGVNEYSVNYNQGPVNVTYAVTKQDSAGVGSSAVSAYATGTTATTYTTTDGTATNETKTLGGNYTTGALTLYFINQQASTNSTTTRNTTGFSAKYVMGANTLLASTASAKNDTNGTKSTMTSLGLTHALSKTTDLYARYENIADDGGFVSGLTGVTSTDNKRTRTALGIKVGF